MANKKKIEDYELKLRQLDERLKLLNERPVNSTMGMYTVTAGSTTEPEPSGSTLNPNFDQDDSATDTTGLFAADGTILLEGPPITTASPDDSYILGPMSSMWYAWGDFTQIGYIRQSDRKMVNLARITGELQDWDKVSNFTSYGQLTLEQAVWYCNAPKYQNGYANYRAFYPGPPSNTPDEFGRYYCTIVGTPKSTRNDPFPDRTPPTQGGPDDVGYPWPNLSPEERKKKKKKLDDLMSKDPSSLTDAEKKALNDAGLDDFTKGGDTQSPLGNLALLGLTFAGVKAAAAAGLGLLGKALGLTGAATQVAPFIGSADSAGDYNKQLAMKLPSSILSGTPAEIKLTPSAAQDQINSVDPAAVERHLTVGGEAPKPSADSTVRPQNKGQILTGDWGTQGGSEIHYNPATDTVTITSEKTLRTTSGGNQVQTDSTGRITSFSDIPTPPPEKVDQISKDLLDNPIIDAALGGLGNVYNAVTGQRGDFQPAAIGPNPWDMIKNDPAAKAEFTKQLSQQGTSLATGAVQGTASNAVALRQALTNLGVPPSEVERTGGAFGQVYSQTNYSGDQIPANIRSVINKKPGTTKESYKPKRLMRKTNKVNLKEQTSREKRKRILREVKQPYVLREVKKEKYKFKKADKVRAKYGRTVNPDMMKQAEVPTSFKKMEDRMWGKYEKEQNARASQDKKNVVLDHLGGTDHVLEYIFETGREKGKKIAYGNYGAEVPKKVVRKEQLKGDNLLFIADENGKKETILQSEINDKLDQKHTEELFAMYENSVEPLSERLKRRLTE